MIKTTHYTISRERLPIHEWIGLDVEIVHAADDNKKGIQGKIVDESTRMLVIETKQGEKKIPKNENTFVFHLGNEKVILDGKKFVRNPINRLKNGGTA